ncbi:MAG: right-handed parallel beta-helix repeat-containing protein [Candidatus Moraniibacteriota bacterium]|nr:MAG: right-handed parallel beta-helix repeat-containing protein [Candidatus Moranbacteria bacterium]
MNYFSNKKTSFGVGVFAFMAIVLAIPFLAIGDSYKELYVDKNASGTENGSKNHPFKTISQAIEQVKDNDGTKIYVAKGKYEENINIPEDAQIIGAGSSETTIKADDDDDTVVYMEHGTKLSGVTVENGKQGIIVKKKSRAEISNVIVQNNDKEGILVLGADSKDERYEVTISKSIIRNNEWSGLYVQEDRKIVLIKSSFSKNDGNGMALSKSVELWAEDSSFEENEKSGVLAVLDNSDISLIDCDINENNREGLELNAYGSKGYANIDNVNFEENNRYGFARISRNSGIEKAWKNVTEKNNTYKSNEFGGLSSILKIF